MIRLRLAGRALPLGFLPSPGANGVYYTVVPAP